MDEKITTIYIGLNRISQVLWSVHTTVIVNFEFSSAETERSKYSSLVHPLPLNP